MKLFSRNGGNTKVKKSMTEAVHIASLSMYPTDEICPARKAAGCDKICLKDTGLATVYSTVNEARLRKTEWYLSDPDSFVEQMRRELHNFTKWCAKHSKQGVVRANTISDIRWEKHGLPQEFTELMWYDYTKLADRFHKPMPNNYKLMFSYSGAPKYKAQVRSFLSSNSDAPMSVVFRTGDFPKRFLDRDVIDGDASDWTNVSARNKVVALKAKGKAKHDTSGFVVDTNHIPLL